MNCKNCGAELTENAVFCGNCGMKVENEQPVYEEPVQQDFHQEVHTEYQEEGSYVPPVMPAEPVVTVERPNTVFWIVISAIAMIFCCRTAGLISLIFSIIGHVSAEKGDYVDAAKKIKIAKTCFWIGFALGILFIAAYLVIFALGFATGIWEEIMYY